MKVTESRPYQISFGADNFGSRFTGTNRFGFSATLGSLFKLGDQISIGGFSAVRGYPLASFAGDNGYVFFAEYVLPIPYKSPIGSRKLTLNQVLSFVGFVDHAKVFVLDKQPSDSFKNRSISGAGGRIRINVPKSKPNNLSASFSLLYSVPVFRGLEPSARSDGTVYVNGIITY